MAIKSTVTLKIDLKIQEIQVSMLDSTIQDIRIQQNTPETTISLTDDHVNKQELV